MKQVALFVSVAILGNTRAAEDGNQFCGSGTAWNEKEGVCVVAVKERRARASPQIRTDNGDILFEVQNGKNVGYKMGDTVVNFDDLAVQCETDAAARRDVASLEFGARIGKLEAVSECKDENSKAVSNLNRIVATAKDNFDASREGMKAETAAANKETLAATKNAASAGDKETLAAAKLADSALKVELTETIAKSTSPATAHIVACQKLQMWSDDRCITKTNAHGCYATEDHCLCEKASKKDSNGKLTVIEDFDLARMCKSVAAKAVQDIGSRLEMYMPFDNDNFLNDCKGASWYIRGPVTKQTKTAFKGEENPGSAGFLSGSHNSGDRVMTRKQISFSADFTIEATVWASGVGTNGYGAILSGACYNDGACRCQWANSGHCGWIFRMSGSSKKLYFESYGKNKKTFRVSEQLPFNKWVHVAVSRKDDVLCMFQDGKSVGCQSGWKNIDVTNSGTGTGVGVSWFKGPDNTYPLHYWQGYLDQVAAYSIGYSADEFANGRNFNTAQTCPK